ncbi:MAG: hypothetical protein Q7S16_02180 [bacterium]|nr:hypothetical protein [bacterium]
MKPVRAGFRRKADRSWRNKNEQAAGSAASVRSGQPAGATPSWGRGGKWKNFELRGKGDWVYYSIYAQQQNITYKHPLAGVGW